MIRSKQQLQAAAAILAILLLAGVFKFGLSGLVVRAQDDAVVERVVSAGTTGALLQYQGRLSDPASGDPVPDGSYTMTLRLYSSPSGGAPLWMEVEDVPVRDGLFSTVLGDITPLERTLFNGRELWLGVKVGADEEAAPRQQILPVAHALSLVPGASVNAPGGSTALSLSGSGSGKALYASGPVVIDGNLTVNGTLMGSHAADPAAHHGRYTDAEAADAALNHPDIVTEYEFADHIYGGMHDGRALAYGVIRQDGTTGAATGNVSSKWDSKWQCYEITIDGHSYDSRQYVTVVTPIIGIANAWAQDNKLCVGIYDLDGQPFKSDFSFVTFQP